MIKRCVILIISFLLISSAGIAQTKKTYFAVGLFAGAHSSMITFAFVTFLDGQFVGAEVVRRDRFMYAAFGYWPSPANPKRENMFEKHNVDSCYLLWNDYNKVDGYYCPVFDQLWKIRFYEHPFDYDQMGWSQGQYKPSLYQAQFIKQEYGVDNVLTDYIYGDTLFKLLRDVQSPEWLIQYRFVGPAKDSSGGAVPDTTSTP